MEKRKNVIEKTRNGFLIISKILNSSELRVGARITKEQFSRLIAGGWNTQRVASTNASSKRRARSGVRRPLSDAEIAAAISEHSESVNSTPDVKDVEEKGNGETQKKKKQTTEKSSPETVLDGMV